MDRIDRQLELVERIAQPTVPLITAAVVASTPIPAVVAALFDRLTVCYALPLTRRADRFAAFAQGDGAVNDTPNAPGTAVNVIAPTCKTLFLDDDPATRHDDGYDVGRDPSDNGSFAGLFRQGAPGLTFDGDNFEFARSTGDFVLRCRTVDRSGGSDNDNVIACNADGVLRLVGNDYADRASVRPYSKDRELVDSPDFSSYTTGHHTSIDNKTACGASISNKAEVTSPFSTVILYPQSSLTHLASGKDGTNAAGQIASTSVVRLSGEHQNTT